MQSWDYFRTNTICAEHDHIHLFLPIFVWKYFQISISGLLRVTKIERYHKLEERFHNLKTLIQITLSIIASEKHPQRPDTT